jgi:phage/conjugal plasmid C-4 type zinc finger TraR family protein
MPDSVDQAQDLAARVLEHDRRRQLDRAAASARMKGTLHCCDCGCEIPAERKLAVPAACFCVECQEERER